MSVWYTAQSSRSSEDCGQNSPEFCSAIFFFFFAKCFLYFRGCRSLRRIKPLLLPDSPCNGPLLSFSPFTLRRRTDTFGRDENCDVRVQLDSVMQVHCKITLNGEGHIFLENYSEETPTLLNDVAVTTGTPVLVPHAGIVQIATRKFRVIYPDPSIVPTGAASTDAVAENEEEIPEVVDTTTVAPEPVAAVPEVVPGNEEAAEEEADAFSTPLKAPLSEAGSPEIFATPEQEPVVESGVEAFPIEDSPGPKAVVMEDKDEPEISY